MLSIRSCTSGESWDGYSKRWKLMVPGYITEPIFGDSLLLPDRRPELLVWAGHPSRGRTSHYGVLLDGGQKLMVDLVLDRCLRMDWSDERVEELTGAEKEYASALASRLMALRGVA